MNCWANKDDEVVECVLSRSLPAVPIAEYQAQLAEEALLTVKLHGYDLLNARDDGWCVEM